MNNFQNGKWQKEELGSDKPLARGAPFRLMFLINKDSYEVKNLKLIIGKLMNTVIKKSLSTCATLFQVHVNGVHLFTFKHRLPLNSVNTIAILGDVSIIWFGFEVSKSNKSHL